MSFTRIVALLVLLSTLAGCFSPPQQCMTFRTVNEENAKAGMPYVRYIIKTQEGEVYRGVTNQYGFTNAVPTRYPDAAKIELPESVSHVPVENIPSIKTKPSPS